jgi:hypothetical protein
MNIIASKPKINETTAMQIACVIAWLWGIPVIDLLESYTYGSATRGLITSFVPFAAGIIAAVSLPGYMSRKYGKAALIIGCALLAIFLVFYTQLWLRPSGYYISRNSGLFRLIGFLFLGYGLRTSGTFSKPLTFKAGVIILFGLYVIYNLFLWGSNNPHPDWMFLYHLSLILFGLVRIAIVITLWKTLSADSVTKFFDKCPKTSLLVAGLFWGMFFVPPADSYSPMWKTVVMFLAAPIFAYALTVIVRFAFFALSYLLKGIFTNRFWWRKSCSWWSDGTEV